MRGTRCFGRRQKSYICGEERAKEKGELGDVDEETEWHAVTQMAWRMDDQRGRAKEVVGSRFALEL